MRVSPSRSVFGHPAQGQRDTLSARQAPARNAWPSWGLEMGPDVLCDQLLRFLRLEGTGGQRYGVEIACVSVDPCVPGVS